MAGARRSTFVDDAETRATLSQSEPAGPNVDLGYNDKVGLIKDKLAEFFPLVTPFVFAYRKQFNEEIREGTVLEPAYGAWGRAIVLYDPGQTTDPTSGVQLPSSSAAYQVYLQAYKAQEETWPNMVIEIWRANYAVPGGKTSANIAVKTHLDTDAQPCMNDITTAPHQLGSMEVKAASPIIDIDPDDYAFDITDWDGKIIQSGCGFVGTGIYKPNATEKEIAGYLKCSGGYSVSCALPYDNLATTCGTGDVNRCGNVGGTCNPYYQLLATCRY